jgi:hypothetical protein
VVSDRADAEEKKEKGKGIYGKSGRFEPVRILT